jgi:hypothetical protein
MGKRVELVGEHSLFYGSKEYGYTRKDKIDLMWENIGKTLNELGM